MYHSYSAGNRVDLRVYDRPSMRQRNCSCLDSSLTLDPINPNARAVTTQKGFVVDMYLYQCITYHPCYFCDTITHLDWSYDITSPITLDFPIFLD